MAVLPPVGFVIESENFLLRPLRRGDASPKLETWIADEDAAAMLNTPRRTWTMDQQAAFFARHEGQGKRIILGIFPREATEPVGLFILKLKPEEDVLTISHLIGDAAWRGRGVTFEASEALYDHVFNRLGYAKAKSHVRPDNKPMLWLIYTYVWRKEARLVQHLQLANSPERSDLLAFAILAEDWRARPEKFRFAPKRAAAEASP